MFCDVFGYIAHNVGRKEENEDSAMAFKQEPGQSKDDSWLIFETKVVGAANNLHLDFAPFIFEQQQLNFLNSNDTDEEDAFQAKAPERAESNSIKINLYSCQKFGGNYAATMLQI